jgi:outer membrane protein
MAVHGKALSFIMCMRKKNNNMKTAFEIGFKLLMVFGIVGLLFLQLKSDDSIVYVDAMKLMNGYNGMKEARKEYEAKAEIWKSNLDSLQTELESKINEYQTKQASLTVKEKELTEELLQSKQQQFMNYQQVISEKIQKEDQELTTKVLAKVNDYIKKYGEDKGYDIIMAATQYGNIVYSDKGKDITDMVLDGLNKEYAN